MPVVVETTRVYYPEVTIPAGWGSVDRPVLVLHARTRSVGWSVGRLLVQLNNNVVANLGAPAVCVCAQKTG